MARVSKRGDPEQFGKELKKNIFLYLYCYFLHLS